jgi:hypothetical protein
MSMDANGRGRSQGAWFVVAVVAFAAAVVYVIVAAINSPDSISASRRPDDTGDAVIYRARAGLGDQ